MPRPTAAQFAYGSATVVLSALAMLLLSQTSSGIGVAVIVAAAFTLGLLVAVKVAAPAGRRTRASRVVRGASPVRTTDLTPEPTELHARVPAAREHSGSRVA
ncbi:hypothetical protein [Streptomyces sp. GC420]|uniref:hypothetical protein n=1 Tax=Streptomyces sp. GC420 TaxID=2697568 RepID=UPI0014150608|nr:hypothetical protein [Streptomyces sp. GC420]NBM17349.1 hypothetical protein [Streptomyces sp. GC420]